MINKGDDRDLYAVPARILRVADSGRDDPQFSTPLEQPLVGFGGHRLVEKCFAYLEPAPSGKAATAIGRFKRAFEPFTPRIVC